MERAWTTDGLERFNDLFRKVKANREENNGKFDKSYLAARVMEEHRKQRKKKMREPTAVTCLEDWGDEENSIDEGENLTVESETVGV